MTARVIKDFCSDRAANVVILFGITLFPILFTIGAAIDYGRAYYAQARFSQAIDAAALAIGSTAGMSNEQVQDMAQAFLDANYPPEEIGAQSTISVSSDSNTVTIDVTGYVETAVLGIAGIDTIDVGASVEVTRTHKKVELVMVLDNTGSMSWSGKIDALKSASNTLVDILMPEGSSEEDVKMGLVPFGAAVNIGADFLNSGWIDTNALSSIAWEDFANGTNSLALYDGINNRTWNGCVRARIAPFDVDDTPPNGAAPNTLWAPYFAPDEPDFWWYSNTYKSDSGYSGSYYDYNARQRYAAKYDGFSIPGWESDGPDFNCRTPAVTALTQTRATVVSAIDAMTATGSTVIPAGLAWGWRVISPGAPFDEGSEYDDEDYIKAIVLLTDGQNSVGGGNGNHNGSYYNAFGFAQSGHLGSVNGNQAESVLDAKTTQLCTNIKNEGVLIFAITFQLADGPIKDLMRECATQTSMYYDSPNNSELEDVFEEIAIGLSKLRISR